MMNIYDAHTSGCFGLRNRPTNDVDLMKRIISDRLIMFRNNVLNKVDRFGTTEKLNRM